jgi:hypothetical protein
VFAQKRHFYFIPVGIPYPGTYGELHSIPYPTINKNTLFMGYECVTNLYSISLAAEPFNVYPISRTAKKPRVGLNGTNF